MRSLLAAVGVAVPGGGVGAELMIVVVASPPALLPTWGAP